jgi:hypothetical protein
MIRSLTDAQTDLAPYLERIRACMYAGLKEFIEEYRELRAKLGKRSEASILHDLIRSHLETEFPDGNSDGVMTMMAKGNLFVILIGAKYKIRVKKLRYGLKTSNVPTQSVIDFMGQKTQLELVPLETNLVVGYKPRSSAELLSSDIWIVCPNGTRNPYWKMQVLPADSGAAITPFKPIEKEPGQKRTRVVPKAKPAGEEGENNDNSATDEKKQADGKDNNGE